MLVTSLTFEKVRTWINLSWTNGYYKSFFLWKSNWKEFLHKKAVSNSIAYFGIQSAVSVTVIILAIAKCKLIIAATDNGGTQRERWVIIATIIIRG